KISYTGLRAGEKLYEEKLMDEEGLKTTPNNLIHIGSPIPFDEERFLVHLQKLMTIACEGDDEAVRGIIAEIVDTYTPAVV
ncbi:MAG: polysaccharide biosynthesis protein, partial [Clostridia bacterium]|nr:polysaccharide biosynthesis protein [Clostridia bacterium]